MDAGQIMMMPVMSDTGIPVGTAGTAPAVNSGLRQSAGVFGTLLGQSLRGISETAGTGPEMKVDCLVDGETLSMPEFEINQLDDQILEPDLTAASQLAATYAQMTILQTALQAQQQISTETYQTAETSEVLHGALADVALVVTESSAKMMAGRAGLEQLQSGVKTEGQEVPLQQDAKQDKLEVQLPVSAAGMLTAVASQETPKEAAPKQTTGSQPEVQKTVAVQQPIRFAQSSHVVTAEADTSGRERFSSDSAQQGPQGAASVAKTQDVMPPEVQKAAAAQPLPQEFSAGVKNAATAVQQPIRFAQSSDVVTAAADTSGQEGLSSDSEQQGSHVATKMIKTAPAVFEAVLPELSAESVNSSRPVENHQMNPGTGHQRIVENTGELIETPSVVVPEPVGRQVTERLANHEIKPGNDQISFKLSPENLGNLQLNLRMDDQRLKLEIVAENRGVRDALLQQVDELKETLARQNISMDSFSVTTGNNNSLSQQSRDWRQMTAEQRQYQPQYAAARAAGAGGGFDTPVRYFATQYQSTIDVRF